MKAGRNRLPQQEKPPRAPKPQPKRAKLPSNPWRRKQRNIPKRQRRARKDPQGRNPVRGARVALVAPRQARVGQVAVNLGAHAAPAAPVARPAAAEAPAAVTPAAHKAPAPAPVVAPPSAKPAAPTTTAPAATPSRPAAPAGAPTSPSPSPPPHPIPPPPPPTPARPA